MFRRLIGSGMLFLFATWALQAQPGAKQPPANPPGAAIRTDPKQPINPQPIPASMALTELQGRSMSSWLGDLKHRDPSVREQAISVLPLFGEAIGTHEILSLLLDRCYDKDASPRIRAVMLINSMEIKPTDVHRVVKMLIDKLRDDPQSQIKYYAALGLPRFGHDAHEAVPALIDMAGTQVTFDLRRAALAALTVIARDPAKGPDPRAVSCMVQMIVKLHEPAVAVRLEVAKGLGILGKVNDPKIDQPAQNVINLLMRDEDRRVVIWATVSSMVLDKVDPAKIQTVASYLRSTDVSVRQHAALALAAMGPSNKPVLDKLFAALHDKDSGVAFNALAAVLASDEKGQDVINALKDLKEGKDTPEGLKMLAQAASESLTRKRPNNDAPNPNGAKKN